MVAPAGASVHRTIPRRARGRGLLLGLGGGALWGLSGVAAQVLLQHDGITPQWLVTVRMLGGGALLLVIARPAFPRRQLGLLIFFALIGLAAVQVTYLATIAASNAALATIIEYLSIPLIAGWEVLRGRRLTRTLALSMAAAVGGTALLVLGGGGHGGAWLGISVAALVFGLLSAITAAIDTIVAVPLVAAYGGIATTAWGLLLGGLAMALWAPPWQVHATGSLPLVIGLVLYVVVFGTAVAFGLYFASLSYLAATEAALCATVEPVVAATGALLFLGVALAPAQYAGGALVLLAVALLRRG